MSSGYGETQPVKLQDCLVWRETEVPKLVYDGEPIFTAHCPELVGGHYARQNFQARCLVFLPFL